MTKPCAVLTVTYATYLNDNVVLLTDNSNDTIKQLHVELRTLM